MRLTTESSLCFKFLSTHHHRPPVPRPPTKDWRQRKAEIKSLESADLVKISSAFRAHNPLSESLSPYLKNGNYDYNTSLDYQEDQMR